MELNINSDRQIQKMISIINQIPVGMVESDIEGNIMQINAKGVQLLMPYLMHFDVAAENNIIGLMDKMIPQISAAIRSFTPDAGSIVAQENYFIEISVSNKKILKYFFFTVNKISNETLSFIFDDITDFYDKEKKINQAVQEQAVEKSKFEMASGILHDIGNAVVGFGSYLTRIKRQISQNDYDQLTNLELFFTKQKKSLDIVFGEVKANALMDLLHGLTDNNKKNTEELSKAVADQMNIVTHISEILSIQRQYIKGQEIVGRAKVNIRNIISDSLSMLMGTLHKNNIVFSNNIALDVPSINGDKTRLMQVFLNLLKNAAESIIETKGNNQHITINSLVKDNELLISIKDTGSGIDKDVLNTLFTRGVTTKKEGNGLGLVNCRSIIESHEGRLILESEGPDLGAEAKVYFKI